MNNIGNLRKLKSDLRLIELTKQLKKISEDTKGFNTLNMLSVAHREFVHSATVAWLLCTKENHGLGDLFLKIFLGVIKDSVRKPDYLGTAEKKHITVIDKLLKKNLIDKLSVEREKKNIDILVNFHKFEVVLLIENKFKSLEHSDQLNRYYEYIKNAEEFDDYHMIPVFLRLNEKEEASHEEYINLNYDDIYKCISDILSDYKDKIDNDVYHYLKQYATVLKESSTMNNDIKKLCKEIYKENKLAIDELIKFKEEMENTDIDSIRKSAEFEYQGIEYIAQEYQLKNGNRYARIIIKETGEKPEIQKPIIRSYLYEIYGIEMGNDKTRKTTHELTRILIKKLLNEAE